MKQSIIFCIVFALVICTTGCFFFGTKLSERDVQNFIKAQQKLIGLGLEAGNKGLAGNELKQVEGIVKSAGFKDIAHFLQVSASIGAAMSLVQGASFLDQMDDATKSGLEEIDKALADPNTPAETTAELKKNRETILKEWEQNSSKAQPVLDFTKSFVDKDTQVLVKKYEKELLQVFRRGM
jgi:hypothetical protein